MSATLIRTCPLCGLRFDNLPILELHIREDHRRRRRRPRRTTATPPVRAARPARPKTADRPGSPLPGPTLSPGQRRVMPHDERMAAPASRPMSGMLATGPRELAIVYRGSV